MSSTYGYSTDWNRILANDKQRKITLHLKQLNTEMLNINMCKLSQGNRDNIWSYPKYIAHKLSTQEFLTYINDLDDCSCCSRHTGCDDFPNLHKHVCLCSCRHYRRQLTDANNTPRD